MTTILPVPEARLLPPMALTEVWRPIVGHESRYEVSDGGRVRSRKSGHVLSPYDDGQGYLKVDLSRGHGVRVRAKVHKLVAAAFLGPAQGPLVRHLNDEKYDNRSVNLAYGTRSDNARDAVHNGIHPKARKTHCPAGHPYSGSNLIINVSRGGRIGRQCRECTNARRRTTAAHLPDPGRPPAMRAQAAAGASQQAPVATVGGVDPIAALPTGSLPAPWLHDTCPECGFDGDVAVVLDPDQGLMGWSCPDCRTFVTTRDLEDA